MLVSAGSTLDRRDKGLFRRRRCCPRVCPHPYGMRLPSSHRAQGSFVACQCCHHDKHRRCIQPGRCDVSSPRGCTTVPCTPEQMSSVFAQCCIPLQALSCPHAHHHPTCSRLRHTRLSGFLFIPHVLRLLCNCILARLAPPASRPLTVGCAQARVRAFLRHMTPSPLALPPLTASNLSSASLAPPRYLSPLTFPVCERVIKSCTQHEPSTSCHLRASQHVLLSSSPSLPAFQLQPR